MDGKVAPFYDAHVDVADWIFGALVVGFVAVLYFGATVAKIDLSTRASRVEALVVSLVLGGSFSVLTGAWIGLCFPAAVVALITGKQAVRGARRAAGGS